MIANFKDLYAAVFDDSSNDLRTMAKPVRFQLMVMLAWMWSVIFSLGIGSFYWFGTIVIAHMLAIFGVFVTTEVFRRSARKETRTASRVAHGS
jgi:hypothetical protein